MSKIMTLFIAILLFPFCLMAQQPTEEQVKAEIMRLMESDPTLMSNPEAMIEQARKNLGIKDPNAVDKIKDDGMTNSTHTKYVEKIAFSTTTISKESPVESNFKTSFANLKDGIYARAYLKQSCYNFSAERNLKEEIEFTYTIKYSKDGKELGRGEEKLDLKTTQTGTTFDFTIAPKTGDKNYFNNNSSATSGFVKAIKSLSAGQHKILVEVVVGTNKDVAIVAASASFDVNISASERDAFVKTYEIIIKPQSYYTTTETNTQSTGSESVYCESPMIYLDNQTGKSAKIDVYRNGSRISGRDINGGKSSFTVGKGDVIRVNGAEFRTILPTDNKATFLLK